MDKKREHPLNHGRARIISRKPKKSIHHRERREKGNVIPERKKGRAIFDYQLKKKDV